MINNYEAFPDAFKCNKTFADYLQNKEGGNIPLLSLDKDGFYYFAKTCSWAVAIMKLPFYMKIYYELGLYKI
jgi:hypothetical protein